MNILFVCTGNTCRSPMAVMLFDKIATEQGLDVRLESAGLFAIEGESASSQAINALKAYDIDLSPHRSKAITAELLEKSDLILTMTEAHKMLIIPYAPDKVYTLLEYIGTKGDIPDPYGGGARKYLECAEKLFCSLNSLAEKLKD